MDITSITEDSMSAEGSDIVERSIMRHLFSRSDGVFFAYFMVKMAMVREPHPDNSLGMGMSVAGGLFKLSYDLERLKANDIDDIDSVCWIDGHECYHWIFNHMWREREYWGGDEENIKKWHMGFNICADIEIHNHYPPTGKLVGKVCQAGVKGSPYEAYPTDPNVTMEEIFEIWKKDNPTPPQQQQSGQGQGQPQDGQGEGDGQPDPNGQQGQGNAQGTKPGRFTTKVDGNGNITITDNQTGTVHKFKVNDNTMPEAGAVTDLDREVLRQQLGEALKEARPSMGVNPGGLAELVEKMIAPPRIDWRHRFRQMVGKHVRFSWHGSWKRFSRRLGEGFRGKVKDHGLSIIVAIDTSGSVADYELAEFANEIENMRKVHKVKSIHVIECDAMVQPGGVYELKAGDKVRNNFHGRGGTDFRPVFEYVTAAKMKTDMLIYLTDSQGQWPDLKPQYPVIWAVTKEAALASIPWGDIVFLEVDEPRGEANKNIKHIDEKAE
jgi:predicted metal-dependent peptidase